MRATLEKRVTERAQEGVRMVIMPDIKCGTRAAGRGVGATERRRFREAYMEQQSTGLQIHHPEYPSR